MREWTSEATPSELKLTIQCGNRKVIFLLLYTLLVVGLILYGYNRLSAITLIVTLPVSILIIVRAIWSYGGVEHWYFKSDKVALVKDYSIYKMKRSWYLFEELDINYIKSKRKEGAELKHFGNLKIRTESKTFVSVKKLPIAEIDDICHKIASYYNDKKRVI